MSCFIVNHAVIDRILSVLHYGGLQQEWQRPLEELGHKTSIEDSCTKLGQEMLDLNAYAYECRYNEKAEVEPYRFQPRSTGRFQYMMDLRCWLYQCNEGDADQKPLFLAFDRIANAKAWSVINEIPEYKNASWDGDVPACLTPDLDFRDMEAVMDENKRLNLEIARLREENETLSALVARKTEALRVGRQTMLKVLN